MNITPEEFAAGARQALGKAPTSPPDPHERACAFIEQTFSISRAPQSRPRISWSHTLRGVRAHVAYGSRPDRHL